LNLQAVTDRFFSGETNRQHDGQYTYDWLNRIGTAELKRKEKENRDNGNILNPGFYRPFSTVILPDPENQPQSQSQSGKGSQPRKKREHAAKADNICQDARQRSN
jgi:hypothetical protein